MPAAVFGNVKMLFPAPAVLDGGGVLGGAVVGTLVDGDVRAGVAGLADDVDFEERVATMAPATPPITTTTANTISTIAVVERPLLAGAVYAYGAVP
jgi:hypothetical protein